MTHVISGKRKKRQWEVGVSAAAELRTSMWVSGCQYVRKWVSIKGEVDVNRGRVDGWVGGMSTVGEWVGLSDAERRGGIKD